MFPRAHGTPRDAFRPGVRRWTAFLVFPPLALGLGCRRTPEPSTIRLVDAFDAKLVDGSPAGPGAAARRTEWRFDGPAPSPAPAAFAVTRGWEAGPGVSGLAVSEGLLVGRSTSDFPMLHIERTAGLENADQLHAIEVRVRVSAGANLALVTRPGATVDLEQELAQASALPWTITTPLIAGGEVQTYTITPPAPISGPRIRHILIRPTDAAGAEFALESLRLVFRREHLAELASGVSWQGLRDVFHETLVTRTPETVRYALTLPSRPRLDLSLGTPEDAAVTFRVAVRRGGTSTDVLSHTVTTPHRWERRVVDLAPFAGSRVELALTASAAQERTLALWGSPVVRQRAAPSHAATDPPLGIILIQADTLRTDHLDVYGYQRPTAPALRRLAEQGALFRHAITQTGWTKAATPSVLTSLYPSTHGVHQIPDRLPASATTIAEVFRAAGYATLSFSSVSFTGQFTNLHQGYEELHESESTVGRAGPRGSKTSREFVDRFVEWLDDHHDVPFFAYLHFFDPHSPYEPNRPYDTLWADPKGREEYLRQQEAVKKFVADPFLAGRGMATRDELVKAGIDPVAFIRYSKDWYDGSIRGMDAELARLVERLQERGLGARTVIAFFADHGEEFHDHGRMWHGQSVYGEMIRVPLVLWGPGRVPKGVRVEQPVELIDVMPTLVELAGLTPPQGVQGRSLGPLLAGNGAGSAASGRPPRPVVAEKQPMGRSGHPAASESYAIIDGDWKLVHNIARPAEKPEYELYEFYKDPLDQKDLAPAHPDVVQRLAGQLDKWRQGARSARLKPDSEATKGLSKGELEQLRSLGYIQ
jgi:arylsulfatase A-like enzyme